MVKVAKYVQLAYGFSMEAIFFETSFFTATVSDYLSDDEYKELQQVLLKNPECGDVMPLPVASGSFAGETGVVAKESAAACESSITGCPAMGKCGCSRFMTRTNLRISPAIRRGL